MPTTKQESSRHLWGRPQAKDSALTRIAVRAGMPLRGRSGWVRTVAVSCAAAGIVTTLMLLAGPNSLRVGAVFIALGALVLALPAERWVIGAIALVAAWLIAAVSVRYLPDVINPGPPVGQAVGAAAFFDTPYRGAQIAAVLAVAVPVLIALGLVVRPALVRWGNRTSSPSVGGGQRPSNVLPVVGGSPTAMWIGVAILAFTLAPDLHSYLNHAGDPVSYSWDLSNVTTWQLFVARGLVPMKDFFDPYGLQWLYTIQNYGPMFLWLVQVATLAIAGWSLWRLSGGRTWRVIACLLVVVLVGQWGWDAWRYAPGFVLATTYAAVGPARHSRFVFGHLVLFAAALLAAFVGPDVLGIGLGGVALVLLGEVVSERISWRPRQLSVSLALDTIAIAAAAAVIGLVWVATGTATGNLRFLADFSAVSSSSAVDERAYGSLGLMTLRPDAYSLYATAPALLAALGLLWTRFGRRIDPGIAAIVLSASGVSLVLVLKHFVRPIADEALIGPILGLSWAVILAWRRDSLVRAGACAGALAGLVTLLNQSGVLSLNQYLGSAVSSPAHAVRSVTVAFDQGARIRAAAAEFNPARFAGWPDTAVAQDYLQAVKARPLPAFAIVGDSQMTYALLGEQPPYQVELYDAAPIAEQHAMVGLLDSRRPAYVIWRSDYEQDHVPYVVRDPLVFRWMVRNYVPVREFPPGATAATAVPTVDILRRRSPGEAIPNGFWRSQLGGIEALGYIPSFSTAASSRSCSSGSGCVPYVLMTGTGPGGPGGVSFEITSKDQIYAVTLQLRPGVDTYPVRLDRLWFWSLVGPRPKLTSLTPGYTVRLVGLLSGDNLY